LSTFVELCIGEVVDCVRYVLRI